MFKEWQSLGWKTISVNCIIIMRRKQCLSHCLQGARNSVSSTFLLFVRCSDSAEHYCCCHQLRKKWYSCKHYKFNLLCYVPIRPIKPYICFLKNVLLLETAETPTLFPLVEKPFSVQICHLSHQEWVCVSTLTHSEISMSLLSRRIRKVWPLKPYKFLLVMLIPLCHEHENF